MTDKVWFLWRLIAELLTFLASIAYSFQMRMLTGMGYVLWHHK